MKKVFYILIVLLCGYAVPVNAQILAEIFRDVGCANCPVPDSAFEQFINLHPQYKVIPVYFHNGFTVPNDVFYQACKADVDFRDSYSGTGLYNISADPAAIINGSKPFPDENHESYWVDEVKSAPAPLASVTVTDTMQANGKILIHMHVESQASGIAVKPYILLVESNLYYDNPYGYGKVPNNLWNNIFRGMIPAKNGGAQFALAGVNDFSYSVDTTGKGWNIQNMKIVAIVQDAFAQSDNTSYLIYGIAQAKVPQAGVSPATIYSSSLATVTPNPASTHTTIPFTLAKSSVVNITISDALGRNVATIANGVYDEGSNSVMFIPTEHIAGVYFVTMRIDGEFAGTQKIIFE
ncbi:MAG TPA: Omp28-related outer membrane protein [Candidatus Kapabacteria bacterium]|nr:Omp28-related outer membrane protein [Candidatus Kapabacteria bacterium]